MSAVSPAALSSINKTKQTSKRTHQNINILRQTKVVFFYKVLLSHCLLCTPQHLSITAAACMPRGLCGRQRAPPARCCSVPTAACIPKTSHVAQLHFTVPAIWRRPHGITLLPHHQEALNYSCDNALIFKPEKWLYPFSMICIFFTAFPSHFPSVSAQVVPG